jgi:hydroxymethylglutaryl-CoA lyase
VTAIAIREVGPRDGLQPEAPVPVADRVALVSALVAAGVATVEVAAFVSPKAVPAMAGAAEVVAALGPAPAGVSYVALVPNAKGAEMARAAGLAALTLTVSASEAYSRRNVGMSVEESLAQVAAVRAVVGPEVALDVVISCAFGSPYEGEMAPAAVAELLAETGAGVGLHLHDTRGTALVNAYAAMEMGVRRFDTAVGGLGGSPFAAGAGGNLATEDLVHLCDDLGVATGIDLDRLLAVSARVAELVGHVVPSRVAAAGPRARLHPA